jgi:hypothetical protein
MVSSENIILLREAAILALCSAESSLFAEELAKG